MKPSFTIRCIAAVLFMILSALSTAHPSPEENIVNFTPGVIFTGERCCFDEGKHGYAYYGIRYGIAQRFEHSMENTDFGYLNEVSHPKLGHICSHSVAEGVQGSPEKMSEDCLYLDIYVPPLVSDSNRSLPVLVFIHGGGLQGGFKDDHNGSSLAAAVNAVVVVINYRLGALGFLSTGDEAARGNYGLGDCKLAVKWIQKYIVKFGGDPDAITVFGQSAGAGLTSAMLLDQSIRNSIRAAAMLSGSILVDIMYNSDPKIRAVRLGQELGCPDNSSKELIDCLKSKPVKELVRSIPFTENTATVPYGYVVDNDHIKDIPLRAVRTAAKSSSPGPNIVTVYLREDASPMMALAVKDIFDPEKPLTIERLRVIVSKMYIPDKEGGLARCHHPNSSLVDRILERYNITNTNNRTDTLRKFFHLATESEFAVPAAREALIYSNMSRSSQLYRISHDLGYGGMGAFHQMDEFHLFQRDVGIPLDSRVTKSLRTLFRDLAHKGRMDGPNFDGAGQYLELDQSGNWTMGNFDHLEMIRFWDEVANTACKDASEDSTVVIKIQPNFL